MRGGSRREPTKRENQRQRTYRHQTGNFKTEAEREFRDPANFPPTKAILTACAAALLRAIKRVDLKHEGESDEVIYQYTGEARPRPTSRPRRDLSGEV